MENEFRGPRFRSSATITVPLPPGEAMKLFTARGERDWVDGWEPRFPAGEPTEEAEGTVFVTTKDGRPTYWVVAARAAGSVRYARVTPSLHAGTVEVRERRSDAGSTDVDVTYDLTALSADGTAAVERLAAHYEQEIGSWQEVIEAAFATNPSTKEQ